MVDFLEQDEFVSAVNALPLVSVDLVVVNPQGQLLLGYRCNAPAKRWWFTPGGRVRKNEPLADCLKRVAMSELGLAAQDIQGAKLMGAWDHFYQDSAFSDEVSTHYVNLPHRLHLSHSLDLNRLPTDQHTAWRWQDPNTAAQANDVHPYARAYAQHLLQN
jgi:colanic acid biosynthesis protein WcaH